MATNRKKLNVILWVIQIVLALLYLFTGGAKLTLPIAVMTQQVHFPGPFLRFIGACQGTDTHLAIDAVWRIESPKLIAGLARIVRDVGVAEDLA